MHKVKFNLGAAKNLQVSPVGSQDYVWKTVFVFSIVNLQIGNFAMTIYMIIDPPPPIQKKSLKKLVELCNVDIFTFLT